MRPAPAHDAPAERDRLYFRAGVATALAPVFVEHFAAVSAAIADVVAGAAQETVLHEVGLRLLTDERLRAKLDDGQMRAGLVALARSHALDYRRRRNPADPEEEDAILIDDGARDAADAAQAVAHFKNAVLPPSLVPLYESRFVAHAPVAEATRALGVGPARLAFAEGRVRARLWRFLREGVESSHTCPHLRNVDQHFAGRILAHDERVMRRHLPGCPDCRRRYERLLAGARLDPRALPAPERLGRGLGLLSPPPVRRWVPLAGLGVALAACALLFAGPSARAGLGQAAVHAGDASDLLVWRAHGGGPTWRLAPGAHVAADEPLAFAYRNPEGWTRLCIFATDEHGHVYWYYPSGGEAAEDARTQHIHFSTAPATLEATAVPSVDGSKLTVTALFARDDAPLAAIAGHLHDGTLDAWQQGRGRVVRLALTLDR